VAEYYRYMIVYPLYYIFRIIDVSAGVYLNSILCILLYFVVNKWVCYTLIRIIYASNTCIVESETKQNETGKCRKLPIPAGYPYRNTYSIILTSFFLIINIISWSIYYIIICIHLLVHPALNINPINWKNLFYSYLGAYFISCYDWVPSTYI